MSHASIWWSSLQSKMNLVKKLSPVLLILIWIAKFLTRAQCNVDECCYSYASVPHNDTFCVPDGEQVDLNCAIINPHDSFTNLTVTWFRSTTGDISIFDEIPATSEEYSFINFVSGRADNSLSVINCSHELYRDSFLLIIHHFTRHKNGYYWCQLSINNTLVQPSYRAQFSVGECNITNQGYYRLANLISESKCAHYVATESDSGLTTTYKSSGTSFVASSTESKTSSSVTQQERESDNVIIYVVGSFSALLFIALLGILALAFSFAFYVHHLRKKTKHEHMHGATSELENQEYDDISTGRATAFEEEKHVYQTLKLNEMNYESIYAKIMPTKK